MASSEGLVEESLIKGLFKEIREEVRTQAAWMSNNPGTRSCYDQWLKEEGEGDR